MLSREELERYARQCILPEMGKAGQERLKQARIVVIGAGGLGCPSTLYLAAAGVGRIVIVDDDVVEASNLQRQVIFTSQDVGKPKAIAAAERLRELNPFVRIEPIFDRLTSANAAPIFRHADLVLDGSDNFGTRYLVNDACVAFDLPFVAAALYRFQGQLSVYNGRTPTGRGPTYRCLFPEPPDPGSIPNCAQAGVLGALPGVMGSLQAIEAMKYLVGFGEPLVGRVLVYHALEARFESFRLRRQESVVAETALRDPGYYEGLRTCSAQKQEGEAMAAVREISPKELATILKERPSDVTLIDVREPFEREIANIGGELIPMNEVMSRQSEIPREGEVVVYCRSGGRSGQVIERLQRESGYENLVNLRGGILAWSDEVDSSIQKY